MLLIKLYSHHFCLKFPCKFIKPWRVRSLWAFHNNPHKCYAIQQVLYNLFNYWCLSRMKCCWAMQGETTCQHTSRITCTEWLCTVANPESSLVLTVGNMLMASSQTDDVDLLWTISPDCFPFQSQTMEAQVNEQMIVFWPANAYKILPAIQLRGSNC